MLENPVIGSCCVQSPGWATGALCYERAQLFTASWLNLQLHQKLHTYVPQCCSCVFRGVWGHMHTYELQTLCSKLEVTQVDLENTQRFLSPHSKIIHKTFTGIKSFSYSWNFGSKIQNPIIYISHANNFSIECLLWPSVIFIIFSSKTFEIHFSLDRNLL